MFDEYYSVSLSFWTRTGLREKARRGRLPLGLSAGRRLRLADPDPSGHRLVRELFER
jgi:hypothetical protein